MRAVDSLEAARGGAIRLLARSRYSSLLVRRDSRAQVRAVLSIVVALATTIVCPALMLAVSPLLLGVPHVAASARYLIVRQRPSRAALVGTLCLAGSLAALRLWALLGRAPAEFARAEVAIAIAWAASVAVSSGRADARAMTRAALALAGLIALAAIGLRHPSGMRLAFAHLHNLGAVALWVFGFRRGRLPWAPLLALTVALGLLASGATLGLTEHLGGAAALGVDLRVVGDWLVPGATAAVALPLVLLHAFTDSVHYSFWLAVIPDETLRGEGALTIRMTLRGLLRDFGARGLLGIVGVTLAFLLAALFGGAGARNAYYSIAGFHGYVEGAMLVGLFVRGTPLGDARGALRHTGTSGVTS